MRHILLFTTNAQTILFGFQWGILCCHVKVCVVLCLPDQCKHVLLHSIKDYELTFACNNLPIYSKASGFRVFLETLALWKPTAQLLEVRNVSEETSDPKMANMCSDSSQENPKSSQNAKRLVCLQHDNDLQTNSRLRWWCNRSCALMIRRMRRGTALHLFLKKTLSCDL